MNETAIAPPSPADAGLAARLPGMGMAAVGAVAAFSLASLWMRTHGLPSTTNAWQWAGYLAAWSLLATSVAVGLDSARRVRAPIGVAAASVALLGNLAIMAHALRGGLGPERVPPALLLSLVLVAALLLARWRWAVAAAGALAVGVVALMAVLEHILATPWAPLGPHARALNPAMALCLLLLSGGWLCAQPRRRPLALLFERGSAGWLARRLSPLILVFPTLMAWLRGEQHRAHPLGTWICLSLIIALTFLVFLTLVWKAATALDRLDLSRAALQAHAHEIHDLYNHAPCGYHSLDTDGRYVKINDTELRWLGYRRDEVVGRLLFADLLTADSRALFERGFPSLHDSGAVEDLELEMRRKDGSLLTVVMNTTVIRDPQGGFFRSRSTLFDATRRKRAEAAMRASETRLRLVLDSTGEGIFVLDLEGVCTLCNSAAVRLLGYGEASELIGQPMHQLIHHTYADGTPYQPEACKGLLALRDGTGLEVDDEVFWRADGTPIPVEYRSYPVKYDGQAVGSVVTFTDVTARRRLEDQVRQSQKMEAVGRLAAGVAHDFNNLLTVINGYSEMLLESELPAPALDKLRSVRKAGERAATLTQQLLAFGRQQVLEPRVLNLNDVVREMEPLLRSTLKATVALSLELTADLGPVRADPGQLGQILMNLVGNARDALPGGGGIRIATTKATVGAGANHPGLAPGEYAVLAVHDDGTGMRPETQAHIFEPFFTTKPKGQGTGLGLPTVFGIARQSGGGVLVDSRWGEGTAMRVFLPIHAEGSILDQAAAATGGA